MNDLELDYLLQSATVERTGQKRWPGNTRKIQNSGLFLFTKLLLANYGMLGYIFLFHLKMPPKHIANNLNPFARL